MAEHKKHGAGIYVVVALILGVITFVEFAIVEYEIAWLSNGQTLFWLAALSVVKFWMVIWFFMHLRDDPKIYTGFFSSGMFIALGTFVALSFLFILPASVAPIVVAAPDTAIEGAAPGPDANLGPAAGDHGAAPAETHAAEADTAPTEGHGAAAIDETTMANIESDGDSRTLAERADSPRPSDRTLRVTPPAAAAPEIALNLDDTVTAAATPASPVADAPAADAAATDAPAADAAAADTAAADTAAPDAAAADTSPAAAADAAPAAQAVRDPEFDRELGASVYASNCVGCHQATGAGVPGAFPPLAQHAADVYAAEGGVGGRQYLMDVVLYGLQGPILVNGTTYNGLMPAWQQLSDEQIAAVINHVVAGFAGQAPPEGFDAIRPDEVAAQRDRGLSAADVHALREDLVLE